MSAVHDLMYGTISWYCIEQCMGSNWEIFANQYLFQKESPISDNGKIIKTLESHCKNFNNLIHSELSYRKQAVKDVFFE